MRSIKVRDCMTPQVVTLSPSMEVVEAIRILLHHDITAAPVLDAEGILVGILSESDCLQGTLLGSYHSQEGGLVSEHMTTDVVFTGPDDDIISAFQQFMKELAYRLPVIESGKLVGMISPKDIMSAVLEFYERPVEHRMSQQG